MRTPLILLLVFLVMAVVIANVDARPPIRRAFFNVYSDQVGSRLDDLTSNAGHCGVCHFDFDGGGTRNPYGASLEAIINDYPTFEDAIMSLELLDADGDGFDNVTEITSASYTNTPTFPGLYDGNVNLTSNVDLGDITPYLTPSGSNDTIPPVVTLLTPNGGGSYPANNTTPVTWTATDENGIAYVNIYLSDDNGATYKPVGINLMNTGTFDWFVPNLPGITSLIRVEAYDTGGNSADDDSDVPFEITAAPGRVPTTLRDMHMPGSQPLTGTTLNDPDANCRTCHGDYNSSVEPWYLWKGSMMAQAMRDPLFQACVTVAEQDAPSVGDLCLRCHTPGGWLAGRSVDTSGGLINTLDRQGIQCDFCHRLVDPNYVEGVSPVEDQEILDKLDEIPLVPANGQFVTDPGPYRRGPYADALASHQFLDSQFHRECDLCGTCHDVSNPVFVANGDGTYSPNAFDTEHPDFDLRNMFPIERTYSEWTQTEYATTGVYAPQFAGDKPDGIVSSCQDCHMRDTTGKGCSEPGAPNRTDLAMHDLTGGNYLIPDLLPDFYPSEVDAGRLAAGKQRALDMLQLAASLALSPGQEGLNPTLAVTVTNETAHKLPSGYPEGRRIWINVKAWDESNNLVYESGAYDDATGVLTHDEDAKIYHIEPGISQGLSPVLGLPYGPSFHFVLNDTVFLDNRIPPRGFTNAAFEAVQSAPHGYSYPDGQYWDETLYTLPEDAVFAEVNLYYQTTSKEYVEFLRDENVTNSAGDDLYDAWVAHGRGAPALMATDTTSLYVDPSGIEDQVPNATTRLYESYPNPFKTDVTVRYSLAERQPVTIRVFDVQGKLVQTLVRETRPRGMQTIRWDGTNHFGERVASGVYFYRMETAGFDMTKKVVLVR